MTDAADPLDDAMQDAAPQQGANAPTHGVDHDPLDDAMMDAPHAAHAPVAVAHNGHASAAPPVADRDLSVGDAVSEAAGNLLPSAGRMLGDIGNAAMHPVDTAEALGKIGVGALSQAKGALGFDHDPKDEEVVKALEDHYKKTYFSGSKRFLNEFAHDPASILGDLSLPLTGGASALAKSAGAAGRIGKAVAAVAPYADPVQASLKIARAPLAYVGKKVIAPLQSFTTGASSDALRRAAEAGASTDPALRDAYVSQFNRTASPADIVDRAESAVDALKKERSAQYIADKKKNLSGPLPDVDFNGIRQDLAKAHAENGIVSQTTGAQIPKNMEAHNALNQIGALVDEFQSHGLTALEGADGLKQRIGEIQKGLRSSPVA